MSTVAGNLGRIRRILAIRAAVIVTVRDRTVALRMSAFFGFGHIAS